MWQRASFANVTKAVGVLQAPWFREGQLMPLPAVALATRPFACNRRTHDICPWLPNASRAEADAAAATQRIVEVPYGGSVHDSRSWAARSARPLVAVAAFNGHGHRNTHRQMDVRRALLASCAAAAGACMVVDLHGKYNLAGRCRSLRPS